MSGLMERIPIPIEVLESLLAQYQSAGVKAQLLPKDSKEAIGGKPVIKLEGKNIDLVHVTFAGGMMQSSKGGFLGPTIITEKKTTWPVLAFHHIVKGLGEKSEEDLKTELKAKKEGMIEKRLVDVSWEGAFSEKLNKDSDLKRRLLESGTDNLKIEPDKKNDCIRITYKKKIDLIAEKKGILFGKTKMRAEKLPSMEAFDIADTIATYVRSS